MWWMTEAVRHFASAKQTDHHDSKSRKGSRPDPHETLQTDKQTGGSRVMRRARKKKTVPGPRTIRRLRSSRLRFNRSGRARVEGRRTARAAQRHPAPRA